MLGGVGRNAAENFPGVAERLVPGFRSVGRGADGCRRGAKDGMRCVYPII